jgi:hypothetical protein
VLSSRPKPTEINTGRFVQGVGVAVGIGVVADGVA